MKCPLLHGNIQKEKDRERKKICFDFMRFRDSCSTINSLNDSTLHSLDPT